MDQTTTASAPPPTTEDEPAQPPVEAPQSPKKGDTNGKEQKEDVVEVRSLVDLPLARVKRIMKSDADVKLISQEAVVLVTKAAVRANL
jgi:hypothetical protein